MELTEGQKAKILKYLLVGLGVGSATNLSLNLASYLKDKKDEAEDSERLRDEINKGPTVYEIDPEELKFLDKKANIKIASTIKKFAGDPNVGSSTIAQALAIVAAAGGLYSGYKLSDMLHDRLKKDETEEQAKSELENYYKTLYLLNRAQTKTASEKGMTKIAEAFSTIAGTGLGLILLTALGSGWASREFMKKQYPKLNLGKEFDHSVNSRLADDPEIPIFIERKKEDKKEEEAKKKENSETDTLELNESVGLDSDIPTNVNYDKNEVDLDENDAFAKLEKFSFEKCASYINESILRLCYEFEKSGKQGSVTSLVKSAAEGFTSPLKESVENYNVDYTIFDLADNLSSKFTKTAYSKEKEQIALTWLATDPAISSAIMPQIAAEFINHTPVISKLASEIPANEHLYSGLLTASVIQSRNAAFKPLVKKLASAITTDKIIANSTDTSEVDFADTLESILQSNSPLVETISKSLN